MSADKPVTSHELLFTDAFNDVLPACVIDRLCDQELSAINQKSRITKADAVRKVQLTHLKAYLRKHPSTSMKSKKKTDGENGN